jgi:hypothetical protein
MKMANKHFKGWCELMEFGRMPSEVKWMLKEAFSAGFVSGVCTMEKAAEASSLKLLEIKEDD